jgi:hypothetical protein
MEEINYKRKERKRYDVFLWMFENIDSEDEIHGEYCAHTGLK